MKKSIVTTTLIQGGLLIAFAGGFFLLTQNQIQPQDVYVFTRTIEENTVIKKQDVTKKSIPKDAVTKDMVTSEDQLVGKALTTKVFPNEYVNVKHLRNEEDVDPFAKIDLTNLRKISIEVDMVSAVGGNLKRGDKVDLTYVDSTTAKNPDGSETEEFTYAKTFLQDVIVYAVVDEEGRQYIDQTGGYTTITDENGEIVESGEIAVVTLAVTAEQAEEIQARMESGQVKIVGRFDKSVDVDTNGFTVGEYGEVKTELVSPETK